jgi:hypothetical protein
MRQLRARGPRRWPALIAVACTSCTGQLLYTTPRTLRADDVQVILAPEYMARTRAAKPLRPTGFDDGAEAPPPPTVTLMHAGLRTGVGERGEVAMHGDLPGSFGVDVKWNVVRTAPFDLALMTRFTVAGLTTQPVNGPYRDQPGAGGFLHLPILLGFNVDRLTFVLSPGSATLMNAQGRLTQGVRTGAAVQLRITSRFALQPEASWMHEVAGPTDMAYAAVGLGIIFVKLPSYE